MQCKNLRWERENIGSYTWTFVLPAQPTDEKKGRGGGGGSEKGRGKKKVHEGMERKEETQESEGEKDYFWSCACLSRRLVNISTHWFVLDHLKLNFICCHSEALWHRAFPFFLFLDQWCDQTTVLLHLDTTPHIQYASVNKLTLRNLTQQTKNSSIRQQQHVHPTGVLGAGFQPCPQRGRDRCIIDWLLDSLRTSQLRDRKTLLDFMYFI